MISSESSGMSASRISHPASRIPAIIGSLFFLSGLSSLVYEITWSRILSTILGNTSLAASVVVSIFMAGLACGSFLAARRVTRINALMLYGVLEGFIGLYALLTPQIAGWIDSVYGLAYAGVEGKF